jgi:hypothetical protein
MFKFFKFIDLEKQIKEKNEIIIQKEEKQKTNSFYQKKNDLQCFHENSLNHSSKYL